MTLTDFLFCLRNISYSVNANEMNVFLLIIIIIIIYNLLSVN